ncbi:MAG TPA: hypothetical protein VMZ53_03560 [Kofleriaceae bacterium]|nr:hypothetical protein [Kofleriaceae bacterium]
MSRRAFVWIAFAVSLLFAPLAWSDTPSDAGVAAVSAGSALEGSGSAAGVTQPDVVNPAQHPAQALDEVKLARKTSWPLAVWLALAMAGKALAYGRDKLKRVPVVGGVAALLAKGKGAMIVAAVGAVGAAGYAVLLDGGTLTAALVASVVALAGVTRSTTKTTGGDPAPSSPS